jgi:hypothetical protein
MATVITERPHKYSFSENEIRYKFSVSDPATVGAAVEVQIYTHAVTDFGLGALLVSFTLSPNNDGSIYCHIAPFLKSILAPSIPLPAGDTFQSASSQVKVFYIKYRQITEATPDPEWITDLANKFCVLMGGVEKMKFKRNNFFASYIPANKPFLTWRPLKQQVALGQPVFLTCLVTSATNSITAKYKVYYTDGTTTDGFIQHDIYVATNILFHINATITNLNFIALDAAKRIHYYEVWVVDDNSVIITSKMRFYIDHRPAYKKKYHDFIFMNSLGGFDPLRVKGDITHSVEIGSGEVVEHILFDDNYNDVIPQPQYSNVGGSKTDIYKSDAGWQATRYLQETLVEMLLNRSDRPMLELIDGRWIGVRNIKKTQELNSSSDTTWSFPVEWTYAYDDTVFTPKEKMLGAGTPG